MPGPLCSRGKDPIGKIVKGEVTFRGARQEGHCSEKVPYDYRPHPSAINPPFCQELYSISLAYALPTSLLNLLLIYRKEMFLNLFCWILIILSI